MNTGKPEDPRVVPLLTTLLLNGRLMENCLRDVPRSRALYRPTSDDPEVPPLNNMVFLAAHLADARRYFANLLGPEVANPFPELADGTTIDDFPQLPETEAILAAWRDLGRVVAERLTAATPEQLAEPAPHPFPVDDPTLLGAATFLCQHEDYHVGQLAYLRRLVGMGAMSYD